MEPGKQICSGSCFSSSSTRFSEATDKYELLVWSSSGPHHYLVGDDVFVNLPRDKETGKATVVQEVINQDGHEFHGRIKVSYYDGSGTYHVRPSRIVKVLYGEQKKVVVVSETKDFRVLARSQVEASDRVVDIGSSYGVCTAILARYCRGDVLGIEVSAELVREARRRHPGLRFLELDVLREPARALEACRGCDKAFVDLGGDRAAEAIAAFLPALLEGAGPRLVVVKNRELARLASSHLERPAGPSPEASFWRDLEALRLRAERQRPPRPPREYHLVNRTGGAPPRFALHPLDYKHRASPSGVRICRFHNYGVCNDPGTCPFDHAHCHHCGAPGHIAKNCTAELPTGGSANRTA